MTRSDDEDILAAFFDEHPEPRAKEIIEATRKHPHLAQRIVAMAAQANAAVLSRGSPQDHEPNREDLDLVAAAYATGRDRAPKQDVEALLASRDLKLRDVASTLELREHIVQDIVDGLCTPPVPGNAARRFSLALGVAPVTFVAALAQSATSPRIGMPKSRSTPEVVQRTFEEIILASDMTEELKAVWLAD